MPTTLTLRNSGPVGNGYLTSNDGTPSSLRGFCAESQWMTKDFALFVQRLLGKGQLNANTYNLILELCCMAVHPEARTGDSPKTSLLVFPVAPIIDSPGLHCWAKTCLALTLGEVSTTLVQQHTHISHSQPPPTMYFQSHTTPHLMGAILIAQVTAAAFALLHTSGPSAIL